MDPPERENPSFQSYAKMAESTSSWVLDNTMLSKFKQTKWCVTEKIHGANFSLITNGSVVWCAKRKEILQKEDKFFPGYKNVVEEQTSKMIELFKLFSLIEKEVKLISVFGELFGGGYPHPEVPSESGVDLIQTGVYYSPSIKFCAFDLQLQNGKEFIYCDYSKAMELFQKVDIFFAKPLFIGTYQSCIEFDVQFTTTLPALFGLPPLESNQAEGVVIKPLHEILVPTKKGLKRAIVKSKSPKFSEIIYHQAEKPVNNDNTISSLDFMKWEMVSYLTENRIASTESKIGEILPGDKKNIMNLLESVVKEILDELKENSLEEMDRLKNSELSELKKELEELTKEMIKSYLTKKWKAMKKNKSEES